MTRLRHRGGISATVVATPPPRAAVRGFARWVARECPPGARVLNIGAGHNLSGRLDPVARRAGTLVGVDPDPSVLDNATLDEGHHLTMEQYAATDPEPFDLAFSVFVLEHVSNPRAFSAACAAVLRPGGVLMGMTVNKWHYFGLSTWAATRAHVAEPVLRRLRPPDQVERYHVPTEYRINTIGAVSRHLDRAGFASVEFRVWDLPGMYEPYLPGRVRGFATAYHDWVYRHDNPRLMGHLTFCARLGRPAG
jgi:2-polyprenyl-3-methyl-5-hydroxy-6-metoxy-1,4-benzoquinol methylase